MFYLVKPKFFTFLCSLEVCLIRGRRWTSEHESTNAVDSWPEFIPQQFQMARPLGATVDTKLLI